MVFETKKAIYLCLINPDRE